MPLMTLSDSATMTLHAASMMRLRTEPSLMAAPRPNSSPRPIANAPMTKPSVRTLLDHAKVRRELLFRSLPRCSRLLRRALTRYDLGFGRLLRVQRVALAVVTHTFVRHLLARARARTDLDAGQ